MNVSDYFEIISTEDRVMHFKLKGFLSDEVIAEIKDEFVTTFCAGVDSMDGQPFLTLADTTEFKPPSKTAQVMMGELMKYAREHKLFKTVEVLSTAITQLAIKQAAKQTGKDDFRVVVSTVEEGWEKINELKSQL